MKASPVLPVAGKRYAPDQNSSPAPPLKKYVLFSNQTPPDPAPPQAPDPAGRQSSAPGTPLSSDIAAAPVMPSVAPSSQAQLQYH